MPGVAWASLSPGGDEAVAVGRGQVVHVYDLTAPDPEPYLLVGHEQTTFRGVYTPDGRQLATVSSDHTVRVWDLETRTELFSLVLPTGSDHGTPMWEVRHALHRGGRVLDRGATDRGRMAIYRLPTRTSPPVDHRAPSLGPSRPRGVPPRRVRQRPPAGHSEESPHAVSRTGSGHRRRRHRLQRALPPGQDGVDRLGAARAQGAHLRLLLARRGQPVRPDQPEQRGRAAEVHHRALPRARSARAASPPASTRWEGCTGAHPGAPGVAAPLGEPGQAQRHRGGVRGRRGGGAHRPHPRPVPVHRIPLGAAEGPLRSRERHPGLRQGGPGSRRHDPSAHAGARDQSSPGRRLGGGHRRRQHPLRGMWSTPRGCGRGRWGASPASSCR